MPNQRIHGKFCLLLLGGVLLLCSSGGSTLGDEGFWPFDQPPRKVLAERHGLKVDDVWLERLQKATVRVSAGTGAGAVVSPDGLVLLSRHQIEPWVRDLGFVGTSMLRDGFLATRRAREVPLRGLNLEVFDSHSDVSSIIQGAMKAAEERGTKSDGARRGAIDDLVEAESTRTGLLCRVYQRDEGRKFLLYRYRTCQDVRLVFAPESALARFGGSYDNFSFPRHSLDAAFVRLYEQGRPWKTPSHLLLETKAATAGDVVVASGFPGRTRRGRPWPLLKNDREEYLHVAQQILDALNQTLSTFLASHPDHAEARKKQDRVANALKAMRGFRSALGDPRIIKLLKAPQEAVLKQGGEKAAELKKVLAAIEAGVKEGRNLSRRRMLSRLESRLARRARSFLNLARELQRSEKDRSPHYRGESLVEIKAYLAKPPQADPRLEVVTAEARIAIAARLLGEKDPFVEACRRAAKGRGAGAALLGTKLADKDFCAALVAGAPEAIEKCQDPLMLLVRELDPVWTELWSSYRRHRESPLYRWEMRYREIVARERGASPPAPDGSPRMFLGRIAGYSDGVTQVAAMTSLWGLWARQREMGGESPFALPKRWLKAADKLKLDTPMVYACTLDIVENTSGTPVVGRAGTLLGMVFDSNFEGLANMFVHDHERGRALVLSSAVLIESLKKVYRAENLLKELVPAGTGR